MVPRGRKCALPARSAGAGAVVCACGGEGAKLFGDLGGEEPGEDGVLVVVDLDFGVVEAGHHAAEGALGVGHKHRQFRADLAAHGEVGSQAGGGADAVDDGGVDFAEGDEAGGEAFGAAGGIGRSGRIVVAAAPVGQRRRDVLIAHADLREAQGVQRVIAVRLSGLQHAQAVQEPMVGAHVDGLFVADVDEIKRVGGGSV